MNLETGLLLLVVAAISLMDCGMIYQINRKNYAVMDYMASSGAVNEEFDRLVAKLVKLRSALRSQLILHYATITAMVFYTYGYEDVVPYAIAIISGYMAGDFFTGSRNADPLCYEPKAYPHYAYLILTAILLAANGISTLAGV